MPADLDVIAHGRRRVAAAVRQLHHHAVGGRQAHMQLEHGAQIGDEFHPARQPVVHPVGAERQSRSGRSSQRGRARRAVAAFEPQPAGGLELARRGHASVEERAAPDEAGDEAVGRALVKVALAADLADFAVRHHHEPVRDGQRLLLVVRHHDGGEAELALQLADLDAHLLAQLGVEIGERLVEQQHVGPDRERARERDALLLPAGELARQARRQSLRAAPGAAPRARARRSRPSASLRISSPNATFSATVMCGNSA